MQVAALVGGFALAASVVLLFFRIWGLIPPPRRSACWSPRRSR